APEEPPLERADQLVTHKRLDLLVAAVLLGHDGVVLERLVRRLQRVAELVALEDVVVPPRLVAAPVLRVDRPADGPQRAREPLDPDHDPLRLAAVVHAVHLTLGEAGGARLSHARNSTTLGSIRWRAGSEHSSATRSRSSSRARRRRTGSPPT